jgi:DNA-binding IclR family transcriptional regulator
MGQQVHILRIQKPDDIIIIVMKISDRNTLQSVDNALLILDLFETNSELSLAEISRLMEIGKSTAFRLTHTLENRGYLARRMDGKYSLGVRFLSLSAAAKDRREIIHVFRPYLVRLMEETAETIHLVIWYDHCHVILIDKVLSHTQIQIDSTLDRPRLAHMTSTGMALLAAKSDDEIANYIATISFEARTPYSITDGDQLWKAIADVRNTGYSHNNQQYEIGLVSIAVPIRNSNGAVIAAISVSGPNTRIDAGKDHIERCLQTAATAIGKLPI